MGGIQHDKTHNLQKPFPGCLGKMVNLFDLNTGVAGNRLLMDKPNLNGTGSSLSRSQSYMSRMRSMGEPIEDRLMVSELGRTTSNRKSNETPIKVLIAQEVAKDMGSKQNPANVVAKLMGLDTFPLNQSDASAEKSYSRGFSQNYSHMPLDYWQQEHGFMGTQKEYGIHQYSQGNECEDVYPQSQNYVKDNLPQKGRYNDNLNEKKMALVRQKFIEAKRLATDDKLCHSKQLQDALEVLSSNKDLFIKFLQEPNSLFSQHFYNFKSIPPPPETKRITVLKPSKIVNNEKFIGSEKKKNEKLMKKASPVGQLSGRSNPGSPPPLENWKMNDDLSRPTRIIVLKPSPGKSHDIKTVISPHCSSISPKICCNGKLYGEQEDDKAQEPREVSQDITCQVEENLSSHEIDETLLCSVFSNGYIGDESSFNKSVNEYAMGNFSDSEVMSPASRHSWDYTNRFGSPYSLSSFSHVPCSPDSSVCREAKKRLSERWTMMASNGSCNEQRFASRRSSTLGEMLALSDEKKPVVLKKEDDNKDQHPKDSMSFLTSELIKDDGMSCAPVNILRSKSVPASSMNYATRLNIEDSNCEVGETNLLNELTKPRSSRLSFKGKISSLFFSRNKKSGEDKSCASLSKCNPISAGMCVHSHGKGTDDRAPCDKYIAQDADLSLGLHGMGKVCSPNLVDLERKHSTISPEAELSITKPVVPGSSSENQDQPSPISVVDPLFGEDDRTALELSGNVTPSQQAGLLIHSSKLQLIDKSPPIGSIARTLSWDESSVYFASSFPLQPKLATQGIKEDEQEWFFLVQTLFSAAGLDSKVQSDTFMVRWHSPESPLDPLLRDKYFDLKFKDMLYEAKQSQMRSTQKLVFDCVNAALVEITGYGSETCQRVIPYNVAECRLIESASFTVMDLVWARIKEWFSGEFRCDCVDSDTLVVERIVRKETMGGGRIEDLRLTMDYIRKEIEVKILEELVEAVVVELSRRM